MRDDELITAYLDGALGEAERAAFEARLARDLELQRKVEATRLLLREASALRVSVVPRNFILPASAVARPARQAPARPWVLRLASAFAAVLFVALILLDQAAPSLRNAPSLPPTVPAAAEPMLEAAPAGEPAAPRVMPQALPAEPAALPTPTEPEPSAPPTASSPSSPQPLVTPLRVLAGIALVAAVVLGWLSRPRR